LPTNLPPHRGGHWERFLLLGGMEFAALSIFLFLGGGKNMLASRGSAVTAATTRIARRALATGAGPYGRLELYDNSRVPTYAFQDSLPRLPIPKLDETLDKWVGVPFHFSAIRFTTISLAHPPTTCSPAWGPCLILCGGGGVVVVHFACMWVVGAATVLLWTSLAAAAVWCGWPRCTGVAVLFLISSARPPPPPPSPHTRAPHLPLGWTCVSLLALYFLERLGMHGSMACAPVDFCTSLLKTQAVSGALCTRASLSHACTGTRLATSLFEAQRLTRCALSVLWWWWWWWGCCLCSGQVPLLCGASD
jgi:hypothetical protein